MRFRIGIDVGGTFTDFLVSDDRGRATTYKTPSTPAEPELGVLRGLNKIAAGHDLSVAELLERVDTIVHGTTITTNAALTGRGAKTALLTTKGFRDLLNMRRGMKTRPYDHHYSPPPPLVPRHLVYPIQERVDAEGHVLTPLDEDGVRQTAEWMREARVEAVAVSYLWSFLHPEHERRTGELIQAACPQLYVSLSCQVLPQIRAYERHSTTVLNAFVGPLLARYLRQLEHQLAQAGFTGVLLIMQSNGGVMSPSLAQRFAANTLLSGPAGGPMAGLFYGAGLRCSNLMTVDMGGTSFDACLVRDGWPASTTEGEIGGHRIALPILDIHTVGAGGGSIAWIDAGGLLRVGPQSAGADPGPACYDAGGTQPTVTDADLVLGYLDPGKFLGGELKLSMERARRVIAGQLAGPLELPLEHAALGVYRLVNSNMAAALRVVSVDKGFDPREFALVVAGGAGPVHAVMIAQELEIPLVLIPRVSSVFCAAGMLIADLQHDYVQTCPRDWEGLDLGIVNNTLARMEADARSTLLREGAAERDIRMSPALDVRYVGQFHEVPVGIGSPLGPADRQSVEDNFHRTHESLFGYALPEAPLEVINVRLRAVAATEKPSRASVPRADDDPAPARTGVREIFLEGVWRETVVYDGDRFTHGYTLEGPALIEHVDTTVLLPLGYRLNCDRYRNYLVYPAERSLAEVLQSLRGRKRLRVDSLARPRQCDVCK